MRMRDSGLAFGVVTISSHWIGAIAFPSFLVACLIASWAPEDGYVAAAQIAMQLGLPCFFLFSFRFVWRLVNYTPVPLGGSAPVEVLVGRAVVFGMLLAGIILPLFWWMKLSAEGFDVVATTFGNDVSISPQATTASILITVLFWLGAMAFTLGLTLHVLAALKHQFVLKDGAIGRILGRSVEL